MTASMQMKGKKLYVVDAVSAWKREKMKETKVARREEKEEEEKVESIWLPLLSALNIIIATAITIINCRVSFDFRFSVYCLLYPVCVCFSIS